MTPANPYVDFDRYVRRVDGDVVPPEAPEPETPRPTAAPINRHQRRRYAALSRRAQTR